MFFELFCVADDICVACLRESWWEATELEAHVVRARSCPKLPSWGLGAQLGTA